MLNPSQPVSFAVLFMTGSASSSIPRTLSVPLRFHRKRGCRAKNILPARSAHNPANSNDRPLSSPAAGQLFALPSLSHLRFWADPTGISDCNDIVSFIRSFLQIVLLLSCFLVFCFDCLLICDNHDDLFCDNHDDLSFHSNIKNGLRNFETSYLQNKKRLSARQGKGNRTAQTKLCGSLSAIFIKSFHDAVYPFQDSAVAGVPQLRGDFLPGVAHLPKIQKTEVPF